MEILGREGNGSLEKKRVFLWLDDLDLGVDEGTTHGLLVDDDRIIGEDYLVAKFYIVVLGLPSLVLREDVLLCEGLLEFLVHLFDRFTAHLGSILSLSFLGDQLTRLRETTFCIDLFNAIMPELLFEIVYHFKRVEFHVKLVLQFLWRFYLLRRLPYILMTFAVMIVGLHGLEEGKVLLLIVLKISTFLVIALYLVKGRIPIDLLKMLEISHIGRTGGLPLLFDGQTFFGILDSSRLAFIVLITFCLFSSHLEELIDMMWYLIFRNSQ